SDPKRLNINIFMQFGDELIPFDLLKKVEKKGANLNVKCIPYEDSLGVCWARHYLLSLYDGEDYYLQLENPKKLEPKHLLEDYFDF
ncbi:MAG: hypothetical protein HWN79_11870, partial [Candidatus Lokiarchaeota archaeon]|nr:hypothetical protein [Candidatus Lokiarchaeota archaeon]